MSLAMGHAVRRRQGIAPNPQVMAEHEDPWLSRSTATCSVKGCSTPLPLGGTTPGERKARMDQYYQHALVNHPRHSNATAARDYFKGQAGY